MAANKGKKTLQWVCFLAYLLFVGYLLFFASYFGRTEEGEGYRYNLILFREIERYYSLGMRRCTWMPFVLNVVGNVAVFVPLGVYMPMLFNRCKNFFFTGLLCFMASLMAEIIQLISRVGSFDVDDLFLNTLGGLLGYILYMIWNFYHTRKKKKSRK